MDRSTMVISKKKEFFGMSAQKEIIGKSTNSENKKARKKKEEKFRQSVRVLALYEYLKRVEGITVARFTEEWETSEVLVDKKLSLINHFLKKETTINKIVSKEGTDTAGAKRYRLMPSKTSSTNPKSGKYPEKEHPYRLLKLQKTLEENERIHIRELGEQAGVDVRVVRRWVETLNTFYKEYPLAKRVECKNGYCKVSDE